MTVIINVMGLAVVLYSEKHSYHYATCADI
ncbi:hypothetical protein DJ93_3375 [Bacillus clarus]|uniref:Uncharacterized protein n=1 Tax=Bacillus clarus TaxID=2338372 RepID=A0A090YX58_9BACI|nr:hypothetical protein DJ93_3375 [Bacillus clarus]